MILTQLRDIQKIMKDMFVVGQATILYLTMFVLEQTILHFTKKFYCNIMRNNYAKTLLRALFSRKKLENENNNEGHIHR